MEEKKCEQIGLISELMQGRELTKQLGDHLFSPPSSPSSLSSSSPSPSPSSPPPPPPSSSHIRKEVLIEKILSSIEKAINMIESKANHVNMNDFHCSNGSPKSEVDDSEFKHKHVSKKRKTMTKWTEQLKVYSETALEGSLNDGYSWRKYGQKDIHGAKFPRGYYRCTHRNVQGCLATKQVQKSDEDPKIYEITYKGRHTCTQSSHLNKSLPSKTKFVLQENKHQKNQPQQEEEKIQSPQENFLSFGSELQVKIEDFENKEDIFPSFNFTYENDNNNNNNIFSQTMIENNFVESFSPTFMSPTTSESNMFCFSPCHFGNTGLVPSVQTSESDISISDIVSNPNSVTNSPIDLDVFFNYDMDFDMDFLINTPEHCYAIDQ